MLPPVHDTFTLFFKVLGPCSRQVRLPDSDPKLLDPPAAKVTDVVRQALAFVTQVELAQVMTKIVVRGIGEARVVEEKIEKLHRQANNVMLWQHGRHAPPRP